MFRKIDRLKPGKPISAEEMSRAFDMIERCARLTVNPASALRLTISSAGYHLDMDATAASSPSSTTITTTNNTYYDSDNTYYESNNVTNSTHNEYISNNDTISLTDDTITINNDTFTSGGGNSITINNDTVTINNATINIDGPTYNFSSSSTTTYTFTSTTIIDYNYSTCTINITGSPTFILSSSTTYIIQGSSTTIYIFQVPLRCDGGLILTPLSPLTPSGGTTLTDQGPFNGPVQPINPGTGGAKLSGIIPLFDGQIIEIPNNGSKNLTVKHQDGAEGTASRRITTPSGLDYIVAPGGSVRLQHNGSAGWGILGNTGGDMLQGISISPTAPTTNQVLQYNGTSWVPTTLSSGSGTVTSVAMTGDGTVFQTTVSGSPITGSGTLAPALVSQSANTFLGGPTSGGATAPTFRTIQTSDIPAGVAVSGTLGVFPQWVKVTVPFTAIKGATNPVTLDLVAMPTGGVLHAISYFPDVGWAGDTVSMSVGYRLGAGGTPTSPSAYIGGQTLPSTAASLPTIGVAGMPACQNPSSSWKITGTFNGSPNLSSLTAGDVILEFLVSELS